MKTIKMNVPDSLDEAQARWVLARSLYESGELTLEQAASLAELAPTYFKMKLRGIPTGIAPKTDGPIHIGLDIERINKLAEEMDVQESWEEMVSMIGK